MRGASPALLSRCRVWLDPTRSNLRALLRELACSASAPSSTRPRHCIASHPLHHHILISGYLTRHLSSGHTYHTSQSDNAQKKGVDAGRGTSQQTITIEQDAAAEHLHFQQRVEACRARQRRQKEKDGA